MFSPRLGRMVRDQVVRGMIPRCPCCGDVLEAQPGSRLSGHLPLGARSYDLDCRDCRRFWLVVQHTPRSIRLMRMRRFVAAVCAAEPLPSRARPTGGSRAAPLTDVTAPAAAM